jgi:autotransporter-associated beta strand protein
VNLGNATLSVSLGFVPAAGSVFVIVNNDGSDAVTGTFLGLPAGSTITIGGSTFKIYYTGGDGNDVILLENTTPTTVYVDDSTNFGIGHSPSPGESIPDADLGTAGSQPAVYGYNAFSTISDAISAITSGGLVIVNAGTYPESANLNLAATLRLTSGANISVNSLDSVVGSTVDLGANTLTVGDGTPTHTLAGIVTGTGGNLTKVGTGTLVLAGANNYTGTTTVNAGTLRSGASNVLPDTPVVVAAGAVLDLFGFSDSIGSLSLSSGNPVGSVVTTGVGLLTLGGNVTENGVAGDTSGASFSGNLSLGSAIRTFFVANGGAANDLAIPAAISGSGGLLKDGPGTLLLTNANTYGGGTTVATGALLVNNVSGSGTGSGAVVVNGSGVLAGTGSVAGSLTLNNSSLLSPGSTLAPGVGTFTASGATFAGAPAIYSVDLGGVAPGASDLLVVSTVPILTGGTLSASIFGAYSPTSSVLDQIKIIDNTLPATTANLITTSFTGLPEGAQVTVAGTATPFYITYQGGDGNDVVLSTQPVIYGSPGADTFTVTGDGSTFTVVVTRGAPFNDTITVSYTGQTGFVLSGLGGDDLATIDNSGASTDPIPSGGILFDGGAEDFTIPLPTPNHGDVLRVIGNGSSTTVDYRAFGSAGATNKSVTVVTNLGTVSAVGIEPTDLQSMAVANVYFSGSDEVLNVADGVDAATGLLPSLVVTGTTSGLGFESVALRNNISVNIDTANATAGGSDGNDTVVVASGNSAHGNTNVAITTGVGADSVTFTGVLQVTGNVSIFSQNISFSGGSIVATGGASAVTLVAGTGSITSTGPATDVTANSLSASATTGIDLDTQVAIVTSATTSGVGNITLDEADGANIVNVSAASGTVAITTTTGNLNIGLVSASGAVNLSAVAGAITDANGVGTGNVTGSTLTATAQSGIDLNTAVTAITASTSGAGNISLRELDGVNLTSVTASSGAISISTGGPTTVTSVVSSTDNDANDVTVFASSGDITLVSLLAGSGAAGSNDVSVSAVSGSILDDNSDATLVRGDSVSFLAAVDIGRPLSGPAVEDIDTTANQLSAVTTGSPNPGGHGIWITETNAVSLVNVTTADGVIVIDAGGTLDVTNVSAGGTGRNVRLRTIGSGNLNLQSVSAAGDSILLDAVGDITDANGPATNISAANLALRSGGGIGSGNALETTVTNLSAQASASPVGNILVANTGALTLLQQTIFGVTVSSSPSTAVSGGGTVNISAASPLTVAANVLAAGPIALAAGESAADNVDNLTVNNGITIQSTGSSVTLNSGDDTNIAATAVISSASTVVINIDFGDADPTGESLTIGTGAVITAPGGATFNGAGQADTFSFAPQNSTPIVVNGNAPFAPPGDVLNLDLTGATGTVLTIDGPGDGTYAFTNRASVEYNSIEAVNAPAGCYDLVLNMAGFGTPGDFTLRRNAPAVGTKLEIVNNNAGGAVIFSGDLTGIASLLVNGTAGSDRLTVDDVNGLIEFDLACVPSLVFPDNANNPLGGTPRLFFDGGAGADADVLNFALTENGSAQTYAIGAGVGPGAGDGEVYTTNAAGRSLTAYFRNLGPAGSVNRTGIAPAPGPLSVLGDLNANAFALTAAAGVTTLNVAGYTPFTYTPAGYSQVSLLAAGGDDSYAISGSGAAGLDSLLSPVVISDASGTESLTVNDSSDTSGNVITVTEATIDGLSTALAATDVTFSGIETLDVTATSAADTVTTTLAGAPAYNGLVSVDIRGNDGADTLLLHVQDSLTDATLDFVRLYGDAGADNLGGPAAADRIHPVLRTGLTQIIVNGDANQKVTGTVNPGSDPILTGPDRLFFDLTTTDSGALLTSPVIVDTNGGNVDAGNTQTFRFTGMEDIDLYDNGVLTNTGIGDFFLRGTDAADYIQVMSAAQVDPTFRIRFGNTYYPLSGGMYGPYTTSGPLASRLYVYGRGGSDTITMYNTRLNAAFFGEGGDDVLTGGYGDDLLVGGQGNDRLNGASVGGNDEIWGDDFNPALDSPAVASQAAGGNDQVNTYGGNDTIYGQGGNDIINSGAGDDYINGGSGDDQIDGQAGNDRIYGGAGVDVLGGSDGNDLIAGNAGNDTLLGRVGNDIVIGGVGLDNVNGHEGRDALVGDESNGLGSESLAKNDAIDAALLALLTAWGTSPNLGTLGTFGSVGSDTSPDTLWGGTEADAFFSTMGDNPADRNAVGYGPDQN